MVFKDVDHQLIDLLDHPIAHYNYAHTYPPADQFIPLVEKILEEEVIVLATPVYWYAMSALMKTFFDRLTDLITIAKPMGRNLQGKSLFVIATGSDRQIPLGFEHPFEKTARYLKMHYGGCLYYSVKHPAEKEVLDIQISDFNGAISLTSKTP